eukprot:366028-Chlamydomonas_euryale.AAC.32
MKPNCGCGRLFCASFLCCGHTHSSATGLRVARPGVAKRMGVSATRALLVGYRGASRRVNDLILYAIIHNRQNCAKPADMQT